MNWQYLQASEVKPGDRIILDFELPWIVSSLELSATGKSVLFEIGRHCKDGTSLLFTLRKRANQQLRIERN